MSRRALSKVSVGLAVGEAWKSPATTTAAQSENGAGAAKPAAGTKLISSPSSQPRRRAPTALFVGLERGGHRRSGGFGDEPAFIVVKFALGEGDGLAPSHVAPDTLQRSEPRRADEARFHFHCLRHAGHPEGDHAGDADAF